MSCGGCGKAVSAGPYTRGRDGLLYLDDVMTADAMCAACPSAGVVTCLVSGRPAREHAHKRNCPKGRHPVDGVVRWMFLDWIGTPYPLRVLLRIRGKISGIGKLPGCGCLRSLRIIADAVGLT